MEIIGTKQAFLKMLSEKNVCKKLKIGKATVSNWKRSLTLDIDRNPPTLDKMEEMLLKYGAKVEKEKVWILKH